MMFSTRNEFEAGATSTIKDFNLHLVICSQNYYPELVIKISISSLHLHLHLRTVPELNFDLQRYVAI